MNPTTLPEEGVEELEILNDEEVDVASLREGMRLAQDVYETSGVLLLAAGMRITPRFLQLLSQRRIKTVRLRNAPLSRTDTDGTGALKGEGADSGELARKVDEILPRELQNPPKFAPVHVWRRPRLPVDTLKGEARRGLERHEAASALIANTGETLQLGGKIAAGHLRATMHNFVNMVTLDFDLLPLMVSMQRTKDEYLFDHAVNVALLSMTIGAQLGLSHHQLMDLGLAGLLHDVGMLRVPGGIRLAPRKLTEDELAEVRRHPLHTLELLEGVKGLPNLVRIIAFQVHERVDGSGYPRGLAGSMLHPLAMIVSVADAFAAITRPRPYRGALSPYEGAVTILHGAAANKFDRQIVRAMLDAIALVPTGSTVELSTGQRAIVIRANPDHHTRPVVEELDDHDRPRGRIIDLTKEEDVKVVRAHPTVGNVFVDHEALKASA